MAGLTTGTSSSTKDDTSAFRHAPPDANRIPGAPSSMKVSERPPPSSSASSSTTKPSRSAIQSMAPFISTSTSSSTPIQPTDIQLLTTSILSNQERQRIILRYQESLIDTCPSLTELKKALLFLSASSWGQILEERHLATRCSYPPCTQPAPSNGREGRFKIDLRAKTVKAVDELDLGAPGNTWDDVRGYYCGKRCYARSEWVLRWVLGEKEVAFTGEEGAAAGGGGKWQKLVDVGQRWESVELLEDLERENGVDFAQGEVVGDAIEAEPEEQKAAKAEVVENKTAQVSNLLGDLTIVERTPTKASSLISRQPYTVDVPNTVGSRFTSQNAAPTSAADDDDDDELTPHERHLAHIVRYASLATGSRAPKPTRTAADIQLSTAPLRLHEVSSAEPPESDEPVVDPREAAERAQLRRMMQVALDVRREQREQGLLE